MFVVFGALMWLQQDIVYVGIVQSNTSDAEMRQEMGLGQFYLLTPASEIQLGSPSGQAHQMIRRLYGHMNQRVIVFGQHSVKGRPGSLFIVHKLYPDSKKIRDMLNIR